MVILWIVKLSYCHIAVAVVNIVKIWLQIGQIEILRNYRYGSELTTYKSTIYITDKKCRIYILIRIDHL
jgi:hypothetical protein